MVLTNSGGSYGRFRTHIADYRAVHQRPLIDKRSVCYADHQIGGDLVKQALKQAFAWIEELQDELQLPGVSLGEFMKRPSLRHRGKSIIGSKDGEALVVNCPMEIKEILLSAEPGIYFQTDHYAGYPAILMRPEAVDKDILRARIVAAWKMNATKSQHSTYNAGGAE